MSVRTTTSEELADLTLRHMGRSGRRPFLVVIGAMDGVSFDDFHGYIRRYHWSGLFVEPIPEQFRRLCENYAQLEPPPDNKYENSAIADHDGTIRMLTIDQNAVDDGTVPSCFGGMSAIYPPQNGLASDAETVARYGALVEVNCLTLRTLFERHAVDRVDVLAIDAEGWDFRIIRQLDFTTYRPKLIRCEYVNLTGEEKLAITALFAKHHYVVRFDIENVHAVPEEYWEEVQARGLSASDTSPSTPSPARLALVTALFDLSPDESDAQGTAGFLSCLTSAKRLLDVPWPMIIFAPPRFHGMIRSRRAGLPTYVASKTRADLEAFPFYTKLRTMENPARLPSLSLSLALSKQFFLNDASLYDPFDSVAFLWVDPDIAQAIGDPPAQFSDACLRNLTALLADGRMLYLCRPMTPGAEVPGFTRAAMAGFAGREPACLVRGQFFGGMSSVVNDVNGAYYSVLERTLDAGCLGTEDQPMTIVALTHPTLCNLQKLEPDGGLRQFFAGLQQESPTQSAAQRSSAESR